MYADSDLKINLMSRHYSTLSACNIGHTSYTKWKHCFICTLKLSNKKCLVLYIINLGIFACIFVTFAYLHWARLIRAVYYTRYCDLMIRELINQNAVYSHYVIQYLGHKMQDNSPDLIEYHANMKSSCVTFVPNPIIFHDWSHCCTILL